MAVMGVGPMMSAATVSQKYAMVLLGHCMTQRAACVASATRTIPEKLVLGHLHGPDPEASAAGTAPPLPSHAATEQEPEADFPSHKQWFR